MEEQFRDEKPGRNLRVTGVYGLDCLFETIHEDSQRELRSESLRAGREELV